MDFILDGFQRKKGEDSKALIRMSAAARKRKGERNCSNQIDQTEVRSDVKKQK